MPFDTTVLRMGAPQHETKPTVARDADLRDRFVAENMRRIFLLVYHKVGNVADAQDLTQEVFIKVLQRQDQLRDLDKAAHWLSRIATNTAIDFLRRHNRVSFAEFDEISPLSAPESENPEEMVLRAEKQTRMEAGLAVLTTRERSALVMRDIDDMPAEEVAKHLNCSKATVRSHIANARTKFKKFLDRRKD